MGANGYVKLWRKTLDSAVFAHEGLFHLFVALLLRASYRTEKIVLKVGLQAVVVDLGPGQCAIRTRLVAQDLHISDKTLRQRLAVLDDCEKACGIEQQAVVWLICAMAHAQIYRFGNVTMRVSTHHEHTPFSR